MNDKNNIDEMYDKYENEVYLEVSNNSDGGAIDHKKLARHYYIRNTSENIKNKLIGSYIFDYPVDLDDIDSVIVAAYYLGKYVGSKHIEDFVLKDLKEKIEKDIRI